ncbi:MAG TPA: response regulator [Kiritimatiellia bacterium]|nr:response regulator [Kiritimatiellia bacterium]
MPKVLIIEDEEGIQLLLKRVVGMLGHEVLLAGDGPSAVKIAREEAPDLIISDLSLPGKPSGIDLIRELRAMDPARPLVVTTGYSSGEKMDAIQAEGIQHILGKPFDILGARTLVASLIGNTRA